MIWPGPSGGFHTESNVTGRSGGSDLPNGFQSKSDHKARCEVRFWVMLLAAMVAGSTNAEAGGDPLAGKKKVARCAVCHGRDGIAKIPDAPNLAGQKEAYILRSFAAYKSGERKNEQMAVMAKSVEDADLADLAAYYAAIKITVEVPK